MSGSQTILIVEDDTLIALDLQTLLGKRRLQSDGARPIG
jgi:hypothetical protein